VPTIEQLVELLAARYRWGLHPFKFFVALLAPVVVVWIADWRLRALAGRIAAHEPREQLPRTGRR